MRNDKLLHFINPLLVLGYISSSIHSEDILIKKRRSRVTRIPIKSNKFELEESGSPSMRKSVCYVLIKNLFHFPRVS